MKTLFCFLFFSIFTLSQSLNYDYSVTFGNHVIAINQINYDFQEGDIIGCFFINENGQLQCCGSVVYNNEDFAYISAWPDDFLTDNQEGFIEGDEMILGLYLCDDYDYMSYEYNFFSPDFSILHTEIFYTSNGISQIDVDLVFSPNCDSSIDLQNNKKKQIGVVNILGQNIDEIVPNFPYFIFYDDWSVEKKLIIR